MNEMQEEQLYDLLCKQAMYGLTAEETKQLAEIENLADGGIDAQSLELTAASIGMIDINANEPLPAHLEAVILEQAKDHFEYVREADPHSVDISNLPARELKAFGTGRPGGLLGWLGWAVAAAACIILAVNIYVTRPDPTVVKGPEKPPVQEEKLTPAQLRQKLIESSHNIARAEWVNPDPKSPNKVSGDVVWSDEQQVGYIRLNGVPANDPSKETYQLWIFDETQDEKTPISGGIFDVGSDGEVIVEIDANLRAKNPKAFAITVEKPGGVMRSDRKRVVALAPVKPSAA
ncbi:MAG: anti-sigma factor domain-containing protein [Blastocatellia bacterium]